ncbi:HNH endonuclease [Rhizobium sp. KAs_5_22]|uniref:HNH endonuclease signature motif containing protein n=1 Tax=Ciceribacter selenitireducens TaxID=448181 RepID=UPI00048CC353|nr:HNH endonuclease signature motif containing protein [Ciceribacter selenitireducens]PPJ46735.1 HNH endonuclease [Rhizobium sp. KAs_5_22]
MLSLAIPQINHRSLYDQCVSQTQRNTERALLVALGDRVAAAGVAYVDAATVGGLAALAPIALADPEDKLVRALYDKRLVDAAGTGRWAYDKIRNSARYCPYCTFGEVYEVDHFLHKAAYRELNVCPANLVPICHACNHIKLVDQPHDSAHYLLHPYFDVLPAVRWLFADLIFEAGGPVLRYRVELDAALHGNLASRLAYHFATLELDRRFQERASRLLVEIESDLADNFALLGSAGMAAHFNGESDRHFSRHGNSLEAAGYRAAAENYAFCAGQFQN